MRHVLMLGAGLIGMYQIHKIKFRYFSRFAQILIWAAIPLLAFTLFKGTSINNANRWLTIPIINTSFQTSDFAKLVLILYVSRILALNHENLRDKKRVLFPILAVTLIVCGLIFPANFSTAALLFISCFALMFMSGIPISYLAAIVGAGVAGVGLLYVLSSTNPDLLPRLSTWIARIENFSSQESEVNYQAEHAKYAIAAGGILPNGPGKGNSRNFLPHPYSDMIYAFIIEEYGSLVGGFFVMMLYLILFFRSVKLGLRCEKPFGTYASIGLSLMLLLQAFVNMAVSVNLIPVTGQPLPLISLGGTSTILTCITIGIILSISRSVYADEETTEKEEVAYGLV